MANVQDFRIEGIITAPCTPFKPDGEVDYEKFESLADHIVEYSNTCVFANGTTGEGLSLTLEERKKCAIEWVKVAKGRLSLILNVSCTNVRDACMLAAHAESIGVDAISAHTPLFFTPKTVDALVECLRQIAEAAPNTPFYYYDINFMTGINFDNGDVFQMAIEKIPTFRGMKQSSREVAYLVRSVMNSQGGKYQVITGNEQTMSHALISSVIETFPLLLPALPLGVRIPVCLPYAGRIFTRMVKAYDEGNMEAALLEQENIQKMQGLLKKYGGGAKKAMSAVLGMDLGPSRLPVEDPSPEEMDALEKEMKELGVQEFV